MVATTMKTSLKNRICVLSVSITIISTHLLSQMQVNCFWSSRIPKNHIHIQKEEEKFVYVLHEMSN